MSAGSGASSTRSRSSRRRSPAAAPAAAPVAPPVAELIEQLEATYGHRSEHLPGGHEHIEEDDHERELIEHRLIRQAVLRSERESVIELRDRGVINDEVLRRIEREIDLEQLRMEA